MLKPFRPRTLVISPDSKWVAGFGYMPGQGHELRVWSTATAKEMLRQIMVTRYETLAFSSDGTRLAALTQKMVRLFSLPTGKPLAQLLGVGAALTDVAFHSGNDVLVTTNLNGVVREWNLKKRSSRVLHDDRGPLYAVTADPNQGVVGFAGAERYAFLIKQGSSHVNKPGPVGSPVTGVAFSKSGHHFATCSRSGDVNIWNSKEWVNTSILHLLKFRAHHSSGTCRLRFSNDGKYIYTTAVGQHSRHQVSFTSWSRDPQTLLREAEGEIGVHFRGSRLQRGIPRSKNLLIKKKPVK